MSDIKIYQGNYVVDSIPTSAGGMAPGNVTIVENEVIINGVKMPPCPEQGCNSTIINGKVYLNGYELINGKWQKTWTALWHKYF